MRRKKSRKRSGVLAAVFLELASLVGIVAIAQPQWLAALIVESTHEQETDQVELPGPRTQVSVEIPEAVIEAHASHQPAAQAIPLPDLDAWAHQPGSHSLEQSVWGNSGTATRYGSPATRIANRLTPAPGRWPPYAIPNSQPILPPAQY